MNMKIIRPIYEGRRHFIGGSDARIIMRTDEAALIRLWKEKRGVRAKRSKSGAVSIDILATGESHASVQ